MHAIKRSRLHISVGLISSYGQPLRRPFAAVRARRQSAESRSVSFCELSERTLFVLLLFFADNAQFGHWASAKATEANPSLTLFAGPIHLLPSRSRRPQSCSADAVPGRGVEKINFDCPSALARSISSARSSWSTVISSVSVRCILHQALALTEQ